MKSIQNLLTLLFLAAGLFAARPIVSQTHTFADWTAVDPTANTAEGQLGSTSVALTTDVAVPNAFGGAGVVSGVVDESFAGFAAVSFTPSIALTDGVALGSASSYTVTFSSPVANPTLHIYQLANNTLSFTDGSSPLAVTLVSSDGNFATVTGSTIEGVSNATDANGSIQFAGAISQISWASDAFNNGDGFLIQISRSDVPVMSCVGFDPPMAGGPVTVKGNRALPLKALLLDDAGVETTDLDVTAPPLVQVFYTSVEGIGQDVSDAALPAGLGDEGNQFTYTGVRWQYNLKTSNYTAPGTYTVFMDSGDTTEYAIDPTCVSEFVAK